MFFRNLKLETALLEILIVMMGIFLGFQADNWYQARQDRQLEQEYISRLIQDVEADLAITTETAERRLGFVRLLEASLLDETAVQEDPTTYIRALSEAFYIFTPSPNRFTFDELVSTGNLALISDNSLRQTMHAYFDVRRYSGADIRVRIRERFAGILTTDQMFLNGDRRELEFSVQDALEARSRFINKQEAVDMLGIMAELQFTQISLRIRFLREAAELHSLLLQQLN